MTNRRLTVPALLLGLVLVLTACAPSAAKKLSGAEAKASLVSVLTSSAATFNSEGGYESITIDPNKFALIYDPSAPEGKKFVTVDIDKPDGAAFNKDALPSIASFIKALGSDSFSSATYTYSDGVYHVTTGNVSVDIWTKDDKVSSIATTVTSSKATSVVVIGYGLTSGAKTFIATATANEAK